jgi:hypothetical protein
MAAEPAVRVVQACCLHCHRIREYHPNAVRLILFTNTAMVFEYFCLACHAYNKQRILDIEIAEGLTAAGVPTTVVHVPLEVVERESACRGRRLINEKDCTSMEGASLAHFNAMCQRELI